jgi:hypothetical protein
LPLVTPATKAVVATATIPAQTGLAHIKTAMPLRMVPKIGYLRKKAPMARKALFQKQPRKQ